MNGSQAKPAPRRGSSFGHGPRRGTDPEGGERSAWKGLCGPSGLSLDHARIPEIQETVYEHLVPLVVAAEEPLPLSQFTQKCCDVLLPVLEKGQELSTHAFKSQWGRLNEFVCPELARRAGLGDSGFSREVKMVRLDLSVASSSSSLTGQQRHQPPAVRGLATQPAAAVPSTAVPVAPPPAAPPAGAVFWSPLPATSSAAAPDVSLSTAAPPALPTPVAPVPVMAPALCAYCQAPHSMRNCPFFHTMLQSIYQAGYQHGVAMGQKAQHVANAGRSSGGTSQH